MDRFLKFEWLSIIYFKSLVGGLLRSDAGILLILKNVSLFLNILVDTLQQLQFSRHIISFACSIWDQVHAPFSYYVEACEIELICLGIRNY